ncbi:hypothetical protein B0H11DRAFT_2000814 [Mycena galericulata]|nr:hypothetical protein B0H11DRAFT_2000814 [Mycena galericulata]
MSTTQSFKSVGETLMYIIFDLVAQTFFFGVYTVLVFLSTRTLLKRGLKTQTNYVMFSVISFMYLLSAAYWAYSIAEVADRMSFYISAPQNPLGSIKISNHDNVTEWSPLFNAVILMNFVLSDGVVVWRARVICHGKLRKYLWFTIVFLLLTATAVLITIGFRATAFVESPIANLPKGNFLNPGINILQISALSLSLASNVSATAVVGVTVWRHRRILRSAFGEGQTKTRAGQTLVLVVESGVLYCIFALTLLLACLIRLPHGTLGDLYTPISVLIAGAYPPIVILLVSVKPSLNEPHFAESIFNPPSPSKPLDIIGGSAYTSPTSTVGGPEPMDIVGIVRKPSLIIPEAKPVQLSRFSDDSLA